mgnify:CR=1 FL=1
MQLEPNDSPGYAQPGFDSLEIGFWGQRNVVTRLQSPLFRRWLQTTPTLAFLPLRSRSRVRDGPRHCSVAIVAVNLACILV